MRRDASGVGEINKIRTVSFIGGLVWFGMNHRGGATTLEFALYQSVLGG